MRTQILYEDERIKIARSQNEANGHDLYISGEPYFLARGVLDDWAQMVPQTFRASLDAYNPAISKDLCQKQIPTEELGWALAKAKIRSSEDEISEIFGFRKKSRKEVAD